MQIFASPIVAHIKQDNVPHNDLVEMVKSHFDNFDTLIKMVATNDMLMEMVNASISKGKTENAVEAEALLKAYDSQINLWSG